ncbi:hypothetical protein GGH12_003305 [Coemansia sp. RSA 1822]|nr:hypothetical protein LPJ76_003171 [Coemansia sp. RSA 638]KAJ2122684.1 hypothetical protein IW147_003227 [Coemansia sp. RSA 720]KAJ2562322.1 hypothetical protein GGH12_003305 [Coemansia sp. RSA 1822]
MYKLACVILLLALLGQTALAKWSMTQQPAEERARTCQEQVSFCYNACGTVSRTTVNFCNIRTMGWNCACEDKAAEARVRQHEWPATVAECRAALGMCNTGCAARTDGIARAACYTSCTTDYQCSTAAAPRSSLQVQSISDKPAGYIPPIDNRDIELTIGMKFDSKVDDQSSRRMQKSGELGSLPKIVPKSDDDSDEDLAGSGKAGGGVGSGHKHRNGSKGQEVVSLATSQHQLLTGFLAGALALACAALQ